MTPLDLGTIIARQMRERRERADQARIKVNLYTAAETRAVAEAVALLERAGQPSRVDCLMVGDSYLMTHLGRPSTRIDSPQDQAAVFAMMLGLVAAVAEAVAAFDQGAGASARPWIMGDLPDGAAATPDRALDSVARMTEAGAAVVKIEVVSPHVFDIIEEAARRGFPVAAHIGYTPQSNANRKYGDTEPEFLDLIAQARRARDCGAVALVVERVSQPVNALLCRPHPKALPVYGIFSGRVAHGGQSLNVFDSVIRPDFPAKAFPPTATLPRSAFPAAYSHATIVRHFAELLGMAYAGAYPRSQSSVLAEEVLQRLTATVLWD